ncbi:ABC transporter ATP-binding protein [Lucifera butyrica]|uniref:ABC transporter ATP-binding protein n=1 Tax=Lucifera butyrica TaxID=1351585 RepID=UPI000F019EFA|nr:sn-glycerol-3-phosphate ABC transporter ATP-binding protein UgpC [Lucifera butyrica]
MSEVRLNNIWKRYGANAVVQDVNLEIHDKEFLVLVGPSGCGKSTTLRMIAGLEEITAGDIYIGSERVNGTAPKERDIAMVFQNYALYPHMNVYENMAFGLKMRKAKKEAIEKRVNEAARILDLEHLLTRKPKDLSGGQRQRVALGRAIVREPKVFLMDEPLSNLDAKLRVQMRTEISKLQKRLQATFIYVTHDQVEAMTMGDRLVVMRDGIIQQIATPSEIYNRPKNLFVAGFIGSPAMNFIQGTLQERNDDVFFLAGGFEGKLVEQQAGKMRQLGYLSREVVMGIRPEDIDSRSSLPPAGEASTLQVCVEVQEYTGSEAYLHCSGVGEKMLTIRGGRDTQVRRGDTAVFAVNMDKVHVFDIHTGQNVLLA